MDVASVLLGIHAEEIGNYNEHSYSTIVRGFDIFYNSLGELEFRLIELFACFWKRIGRCLRKHGRLTLRKTQRSAFCYQLQLTYLCGSHNVLSCEYFTFILHLAYPSILTKVYSAT